MYWSVSFKKKNGVTNFTLNCTFDNYTDFKLSSIFFISLSKRLSSLAALEIMHITVLYSIILSSINYSNDTAFKSIFFGLLWNISRNSYSQCRYLKEGSLRRITTPKYFDYLITSD